MTNNEIVKQALEASKNNYKTATSTSEIPVTFLVMCCEDDIEYLPNCLGSIPDGSEIIIQENIESEDSKKPEYSIVQEYNEGNQKITQLKYIYPRNELNLGAKYNSAKKHATRDWLFKLDADETVAMLPNHIELIKSFTSSRVGYFTVGLASMELRNDTPFHCAWTANTQLRIIRKTDDLYWNYRVHETPRISIEKAGNKYTQGISNILINHHGYIADPNSSENMKKIAKKLNRNYNGLIKDLADNPNDAMQRTHLLRTMKMMEQFGLVNDIEKLQ